MKHGKAPVGDNSGFLSIKQALESAHADILLDCAVVDGAVELRAAHGGMRVFWIFDGSGEVYLPEGYRTLEGDGSPLPAIYQPEPADPAFLEALRILDERRGTFTPEAWPSIKLILDRRTGSGGFIGDIAAYLWNLEHTARPWSHDPAVEAVVGKLYALYRTQGSSVKTSGSWEPVGVGDQLVACGDEAVRVRGNFRCLSIEHLGRTRSHISTARRLSYLLDTAGGCGFDFEPYRRLPLTWFVDAPGGRGDGENFVNAHVVNIASELSSTHFHPRIVAEGGGIPQIEMYLVLDPKACGIDDKGRQPAILLFPDLRDLTRHEKIDLSPGDLVLIPPGVGHRGLDVFVNVLTIPGFKPHNEFYIDQHILDATGGASPYNEAGLVRKNLDRIEDYLVPA
jgi:hypothetical protein